MEAVQTAEPVAAPSEAEAPTSGQPASETTPPPPQLSGDAFDMDALIRDASRGGGVARVTLNPDGVVPTAELDAATSGEPASDPSGDVSPDAVPAGEPAPGDSARPAGRRSAKAAENLTTIEGLRQAYADLEASIPERVAEAQRQADEARAETERLRSVQEAASKQVYELIGDADEYARLLEIPDDQITNEDYQRREAWKSNRRIYRPLETRYREEARTDAARFVDGVRRQWAARVLAVADRLGLDRAFIADPKHADLDTLLEHAATVTEARVRAEYAERLSQAERDRDAARGEAVSGRRVPVTNGQASGTGVASADMDDLIRRATGYAGFR